MAKLGDYIREECHPLGPFGAQNLRLIGVSNELGLHASSRNTSADLARYQRIEKDWFAYNPMRVNVGSIGLADDESKTGFTSPDYTVFSCRGGLDPRYLLHFLKSDYGLEAIARNCSGAVRKRLYYSGLAEIELPIPSLDEQQAFVARIDRISQTIRFIREENSDRHELPLLKQAILQEAIQGKLTEDWRAAHPDVEPASQLLHRIQVEKARFIAAKKLRKERPLPKITPAEIPFQIPKGWEWCRLGAIIDEKPRNGVSLKPVEYETNAKTLKLSATSSGTFDGSQSKFLDLAVEPDSYLWLRDGDILIQRANSLELVGTAAVYRGVSSEFIYPDLMMKCRAVFSDSTDYLHHVLSARITRDYFKSKASGSAGNMPKINQDTVINTLIPLPPLAEQAAIVERVEALMATCRVLEAEIELSRAHAAHLFQAVLKEAFSPPVKKEEKIVAFPSGFARQLLAAEILSRHNQHGMTQMKLQKLLHILEYEARIDEIAGDYQRQAAGPYDNRMMYGISAGLEKQKWFKTLGRGKNATYSPLEKAGQHQKYWSHWESKHPKIDSILSLLGKLKPEQCEIVSTLYAAWNDLHLEARSPTDEEIIAEASHPDRWHEAKAKIDPAKWPKALGWMREKQLIPTGYGRHTRKLGAS